MLADKVQDTALDAGDLIVSGDLIQETAHLMAEYHQAFSQIFFLGHIVRLLFVSYLTLEYYTNIFLYVK